MFAFSLLKDLRVQFGFDSAVFDLTCSPVSPFYSRLGILRSKFTYTPDFAPRFPRSIFLYLLDCCRIDTNLFTTVFTCFQTANCLFTVQPLLNRLTAFKPINCFSTDDWLTFNCLTDFQPTTDFHPTNRLLTD